MTEEEKFLIKDNIDWREDCMTRYRDYLKLKEYCDSLREKNSKLEEKVTLQTSEEVKRMAEHLCYKKDAKNIAEYTDILNRFYDELSEWKYREQTVWKHQNSGRIKAQEEEIDTLNAKILAWRTAFRILFGSWLILVIKLFI